MIKPRMNRHQRIVHRRMLIQGELVLQTPTHLGNGDSEGPTDMTLVRDAFEPGNVLLSGASIAGALRSYLREHIHGVFKEEPTQGITETLFGGRKSDDDGYQSPLIVNDALATPSTYELRDGVKINSHTRTASAKAKYDLELIGAGTTFRVLFELAFVYQLDPKTGQSKSQGEQQEYQQSLLIELATALRGLARGDIALGMKKRRGFGQCSIAEWHVWDFDLTQQAELFAWLALEQSTLNAPGTAHRIGKDITTLLGTSITLPNDARQKLALEATFALEGSLIIRAGQDQAVLAPDVQHLHATQANGKSEPVISGTSLAGVLRHRVERIANTLEPGSGEAFANRMFGYVKERADRKKKDSAQSSRLIVHESVVTHANADLVQNRVSIDRFTGGALDGALFNEQPIFAKPETRVTLKVELFNPKAGEQAMLLLLLKDLWTGDLPIGGESSIGRGRLRGLSGKLQSNGAIVADFSADGNRVALKQGDRTYLNTLIAELPNNVRQAVAQLDLSTKEAADVNA